MYSLPEHKGRQNVDLGYGIKATSREATSERIVPSTPNHKYAKDVVLRNDSLSGLVIKPSSFRFLVAPDL